MPADCSGLAGTRPDSLSLYSWLLSDCNDLRDSASPCFTEDNISWTLCPSFEVQGCPCRFSYSFGLTSRVLLYVGTAVGTCTGILK